MELCTGHNIDNKKNYVTGLCIVPFIIILEYIFSAYKVCCKFVYHVNPAAASYILCLLHLLIASFCLVLDLILCCFVQ